MLQIVKTASTITITASEDEISFTIATANARLLESSPFRAIVEEVYYRWFIYDNRMYRHKHNTAGSTTGMAGNDYSDIQIIGEWYWFPLTAAENTNAASITVALQDFSIGTLEAGNHVTDLVIPANIGSEGFAVDGALHVELNNNDRAKIEFDRTRYRQPLIIHDAHLYTGDPSSPTDHLVGHWQCNDNAANTTLAAEIGSNGTLEGGDNTSAKASADSVRGTALALNGVYDYIDLSTPFADLISKNDFTFMMRFKPTFSYDTTSDRGILGIGYAVADAIEVFYVAASDVIRVQIDLGTVLTFDSGIYASDNELQRYHDLQICISLLDDLIFVFLNGKLLGSSSFTPYWGTGTVGINIGRAPWSTTTYGAIKVDDIRLYNGLILPFGSYFVGNGGVDPDVAHSDIVLYWSCDNLLDAEIGDVTGSAGILAPAFRDDFQLVGTECAYFSLNGYYYSRRSVYFTKTISAVKGSVTFWGNFDYAYNDDEILRLHYDSNNYLLLYVTGSYLTIDWCAQGATVTVVSTVVNSYIMDSLWHHFKIRWNQSTNLLELYLDGALVGECESTLAIMANNFSQIHLNDIDSSNNGAVWAIDQLFITSDSDTPEIPTDAGTPVLVPQIIYTDFSQ